MDSQVNLLHADNTQLMHSSNVVELMMPRHGLDRLNNSLSNCKNLLADRYEVIIEFCFRAVLTRVLGDSFLLSKGVQNRERVAEIRNYPRLSAEKEGEKPTDDDLLKGESKRSELARVHRCSASLWIDDLKGKGKEEKKKKK